MSNYSCIYCGKSLKRKKKYCSHKCRYAYSVENNRPGYELKQPRDHACENCGEIFVAKRKRKYCSRKCSYTYRRKHNEARYCNECGDVFKSKDSPSQSLCIECAPAKCCICKQVFIRQRPDHVSCSKECKAERKLRIGRAYNKNIRVRPKRKEIKSECKQCGSTVVYGCNRKYCSQECRRLDNLKPQYERECLRCGESFKTYKKRKQHCSKACEYEKKPKTILSICKRCGEETLGHREKKYCSNRCASNVANKRRRARKKAKFVEDVYLIDLIERDDCICQICNEPVDLNASAPDPLSPSIDHIHPISKGGEHSYANTQLAHFYCNALKSNKV